MTDDSKPSNYCIRFLAPVNGDKITELLKAVDQIYDEGAESLTLLISTPGGDVFQGLSVYNYLSGMPLEITTHNFGSADSIGVVMFCAGDHRYCVPHARFLLHGVKANFGNNQRLEETQLVERLKSLQIDMGNIAQAIADNVGKEKDDVFADMLNRTTLYPHEAVEYGLVHEIRSELFPPNAHVHTIFS